MSNDMQFNRVFITGDTHGDFDWLADWCEEKQSTVCDAIIILGDAGILYYGAKSEREKALKSYLSKLPITLICIRGNHEDRPQNRENMKYKDYGYDPIVPNRVYYEEEYSNILYLHDGGDYYINGKHYLVVGGAYSVDKEYRLKMKWRWFKDEELTQEEFCDIADKVDHHRYDSVLTHSCPYEWMPTDLFLASIDQSKISNHTEHWLTTIEGIIDYDHWFFGHYHADRKNVCGNGKVHMLSTLCIDIEEFYKGEI